jgi:DNA-binding IclR family transcriptional regulator
MRVVESLGNAPGPCSLKTLSAATNIRPSQIHRYLASLARSELITQDASTGLYDLGPLALRLGFAAQRRIEGLNRTLARLERLAADSGHTAMACAWSDNGPVILRWVQGRHAVYTTLSLGAVLPLTHSATGLVFVTHLHEATTRTLLRRETKPASRTTLLALCNQTRTRGYAEISGATIPGLMAVAAPVFDGRNSLLCTFTLLTTTKTGFGLDVSSILLRHARQASRELGWHGGQELTP